MIQGAVLALAVLAAATPADERLHDFVFRHVVSHEARLLANGFTLLGTTEVATVGLLGLGAIAYRAADAAMWRAAIGGVAGVLLAGLATQAVKHVACRARPRLVEGWGVGAAAGSRPRRRAVASSTGPASGERRLPGFPSGACHDGVRGRGRRSSGWAPARAPRLAPRAASGVGASRIVLNAHFLSDVLGGGAHRAGGPARPASASWRATLRRAGARARREASRGAGRPRDAALSRHPSWGAR